MHRAILVTAAVISAAIAIGAGIEQPKETKPAKEPETKQPDEKPIPPAKPEDVQSLDAIVKAFYASEAGNPGQKRDWDRFRSLFVNEARMIPVRHAVHGQGGNELLTMPVDGYIQVNSNYFEKGGFVEKEVARRAEQFGNIAQVWSTYESRRSDKDPQPYVRGVYSMQMAFDGTRWYILNVMWDTEREGAMLPDKYLKTPTE